MEFSSKCVHHNLVNEMFSGFCESIGKRRKGDVAHSLPLSACNQFVSVVSEGYSLTQRGFGFTLLTSSLFVKRWFIYEGFPWTFQPCITITTTISLVADK